MINRPPKSLCSGARNNRGFVLVNALVLVAALAAAAALLLSRAEQGRARLEAGQIADQVTLGLDAFEAWALTQLARDQSPLDHGQESWARPQDALPLARGTVSGQVQDLQGRFNINWLSDANNLPARHAFDALLRQLGLAADIAPQIHSFVSPGGLNENDRARWKQRHPAQDPVGGPLLSADQLADLPGLSSQTYTRLRPLITALPGDSRLNVNTAPALVLGAFLPHMTPATRSRLMSARNQEPFPSVEAFLIATRLGTAADQENSQENDTAAETDPAALRPEQLSVSSIWFRIDSQSRLDWGFASRRTLVRRRQPNRRPDVIWQVTQHP